jgi:hypothetical protein
MKKLAVVALFILVGAGAYFGWKMLKGDWSWGGWGASGTDPWSSYTPPSDDGTATV